VEGELITDLAAKAAALLAELYIRIFSNDSGKASKGIFPKSN
jgi:hypothetical protein